MAIQSVTTKIISTLGNKESLIPIIAKDAVDSASLTYNAYKAGGTVSQNFSFDYVPEMRNSKLALRFKATLKDKEVQIPEIEIAVGCIATETLACASEIAPAYAKDNFQRETFEVTEADIMFQIQQSNVKANDEVKNLNAVAKATLKDSLRNVESLTLVSAASPDGGVKLNDMYSHR